MTGRSTWYSEVNQNGHKANNLFLSNGDGSFTIVIGALPPVCAANSAATGCLGTGASQLVTGDFNGDGRTDLMSINANFDMWLSTGSGDFSHRTVSGSTGCPVASQCILQESGGLVVGDFNGDGKADLLSKSMWLASGGPADHLITVANGYGITTSVSYAPSSHFPSFLVPVGTVFQTVAAVEISDGHSLADTHSYSYAGALWDSVENRFLGFHTKKETIDKAGTVLETTYNQTSGVFIQPAEVATMDASGNIYAFSVLQYVAAETIPYHCQLFSETRNEAEGTCNSEATCRQTARAISTDFAWGNYGNLIQKTELGDIAVQGDERTTELLYGQTPNAASYILNTPISRQLFPGQGGGQLLRETSYLYDGQGSGAIPIKGDVTQRGDYVSTAPGSNIAISVVTTLAYDTFGNITSTAVMGQTTTTDFDPAWHLAPVRHATR